MDKSKSPKTKTPILAVGILIIILTMVAMAVLIARRKKAGGSGGGEGGPKRGYRKNTIFHGVDCRDTWTGDRLREEYGDPKDTSDWNFERSEDGIAKAYALSKRLKGVGCQGVFVPKNARGGAPTYVFDTSKCDDDILYDEAEGNEDFFGTLHFHIRDSCPEGYTDPLNACRTRLVTECRDDVCKEDEICGMTSEDVPTCFPRNVYDMAKRNKGEQEAIVSRQELEDKTEQEVLKLIADRTGWDINRLKFTNEGGDSSNTERIFCYNGGKPVSIKQADGKTHRYCLCNDTEFYKGAAWGGTRCNVKCPVWIDKQRGRLEQIANGEEVTILKPGISTGEGKYGEFLHPLVDVDGAQETEAAEYRAFFAGDTKRTDDPTIQICGNETREDGKLIRRGTCIKRNPLSTSRLDSTCACVGRFGNPEKGCRTDFCPPDSICDINSADQPAGTCKWRPDEKGLSNRVGPLGTPFFNNEPEDGMYGCDCSFRFLPYKKYGELDQDGHLKQTTLRKRYEFDTEYSLVHHAGNIKPSQRRMCQDPCANKGCGYDFDVPVDRKAECGIIYDEDNDKWERGTGTGRNGSFCLCSADYKGDMCTEKNDCPSYLNYGQCGQNTSRGKCVKGHTLVKGDDDKLNVGDTFTAHASESNDADNLPKSVANAARCECFAGYAGASCQYSSADQCNANGALLQSDPIRCECCGGAAGSSCQFTDKFHCNNNGTVEAIETDPLTLAEDFKCTCKAGFAGDRCEWSDAHTCNGNGTVNALGECDCNNGTQGEGCSMPPDCPFQPCHEDTAVNPEQDWNCQFEPKPAAEKAAEDLSGWDKMTGQRGMRKWSYFVEQEGDAEKGTSNVCRGGYGSKHRNPTQHEFWITGLPCDNTDNGDLICGANMVYKTRNANFYENNPNWGAMTHMEVGMDHGCKKNGTKGDEDEDRYDHPDNKSPSGNCKADLLVWRTDRHAEKKRSAHAKAGDPNDKIGAYLNGGCACKVQEYYLTRDDSDEYPFRTGPGTGRKVIMRQDHKNGAVNNVGFDAVIDRNGMKRDDTLPMLNLTSSKKTSSAGESFEQCKT